MSFEAAIFWKGGVSPIVEFADQFSEIVEFDETLIQTTFIAFLSTSFQRVPKFSSRRLRRRYRWVYPHFSLKAWSLTPFSASDTPIPLEGYPSNIFDH